MARALTALAAVLLTLLIAEGVARLLPDAVLGFVYEDGRFRKPREFALDPTRNALGFHDVDPAPRAGRRRLLLLGDSYVEAGSVPIPETVGRRLEHHLNAGSDRPGWQVVALGRSGWSQRRQLQALREHGPRIEPDLVVTLFLTLNDVRENAPALDRAARSQVDLGELRPGLAQLRAEAAPLFLLRGSRLNQLVSYRLALLHAGRDPAGIPIDYFVYAVPEPPPWREAWRTTLSWLDRTRRATEELGARWALVSASTPQGVLGAKAGLERLTRSYPAMAELEWDLDHPDRKLAEFARQRDVPFLALEPVFRVATAQGARLHWAFDGHWNAAGNDRAAEQMAAFLDGLERSPGLDP